jgi:perosamine synthetase
MIQISKPQIDKKEISAVVEVLKSGSLVQGKIVEEFEKNFSRVCEAKYAVAVNNGTAALHTALHVLGIGQGDEVITTPFTFVATANAILMTGAKPVFVDIEEESFNIDPDKIEKKITKKTKAILAVNLYGQPANYKEINKIARKYKLFVIEDAAQSIGAEYFGKKSGSLADIACFSLYATKNIITGEGGVITTNNKDWNKKARIFRNQGQDENIKYKYYGLGYNYRMTNLNASIGIEQLKKLSVFTKKRQKNATYYTENIKAKGLVLPEIKARVSSVFHQYTLRATKEFKLSRDEFKDHLLGYGIQSNVYYPIPLYKFDHLKFDHKINDYPIAERASKEVISIPVHPCLKIKDVKFITDTINKI